MVAFVGIMAMLQIVGAIVVYMVAKSAVHEILAATMFGMGVLAFALGALLENAKKQLAALERKH